MVLVVSVAVAAGIALLLATLGTRVPQPALIGYFSGQESRISDQAGDAKAVLQQPSPGVVPEIKGYHDVLSASVRKGDGFFVLTIDLAGDPNMNEKYETNYMWHIVYSDPDGRERHYIVMFINFAPDFNHTSQGWFYAVFDSTAGAYVLGQTQIPDMPNKKVEYAVDNVLLGNPRSFSYWVSVYSRVNSTRFESGPEYLMDSAP